MKIVLAVATAALLASVSTVTLADPAVPAKHLDAAQAAAAFGAREMIEDISISPDGTKVAFITPVTGQGAALVTMEAGKDATRKTALVANGAPERLTDCHWVSNARLVCTVYGVLPGTNEVFPFTRIVAVDADGGNVKVLTKDQNEYSQALLLGGGEVIDWVGGEPDSVLMTRYYIPDDHLGTRVGQTREGYGVDRVDTRTGRSTTVEPPRQGNDEFISDGQGNVRIMGFRGDDKNGYSKAVVTYRYRPKGSRDWKPLGDYNSETEQGFNPYAVDAEQDVAYGFRKKDGRWALYKVALDGSAREDLVFARPDVDVSGLVRFGRSNRIVGVSYVTDASHVVFFDAPLAKLSTSISKALAGQPQVSIVDSSLDESKLLVSASSDTDPGLYYVLDRKTHEMAILGLVRPQLEGVKLAEVKPMSYPAADGTMVPGYLTMPPGSAGKNLPAIVLPHGGPAARDEWGFDWLSQFYANRGYVVLQPNFRGSSGYGDAWFKDNGFKSWRIAIGDVLDAGRWLVRQGIADPSKLAIVGWSYGGYAALQSAVTDPNVFKAVVAIAPVTDLAKLKEESRIFDNHAIMANYIGTGPHIVEGSPAQNAARIKVPVLMFHAAMDRNVRIGESKLMDEKLKAAGVPHELVTWDNLDHYLDDSTARALMLSKSDAFLRKTMGM